MNNFRIGSTVINIDIDSSHYDEYGTVHDISGGYTYVRYEDGYIGRAKTPSRYWRVVENAVEPDRKESGCGAPRKMESFTTSIKKFVKSLGLSSDDRLLRKVHLVTECGDYTDEAKALVMAKLCEDNKAYLVEVAKQYDKELKEEKE